MQSVSQYPQRVVRHQQFSAQLQSHPTGLRIVSRRLRPIRLILVTGLNAGRSRYTEDRGHFFSWQQSPPGSAARRREGVPYPQQPEQISAAVGNLPDF